MFLDEQHRGGECRFTWMDDTELKHGIALALELGLLVVGVAVGPNHDGLGAG
jgi:hypothetical protein